MNVSLCISVTEIVFFPQDFCYFIFFLVFSDVLIMFSPLSVSIATQLRQRIEARNHRVVVMLLVTCFAFIVLSLPNAVSFVSNGVVVVVVVAVVVVRPLAGNFSPPT